MDWNAALIEYDWLGHIVEAIAIAAVVALICVKAVCMRDAVTIGLAFAVGHFHGREKRDYEVSVHMPPPHLDAYYFWNWNWDQATDFWPVVVALALIGYLIRRRLR